MHQLRKDNHYIPKLYLKQWATNGLIPTYRLIVPNEKFPLWKNQSLKGIAFHQHLYTYLVGQEETDEFERWLDREFESPAEEAIRRVLQEDRMLPEQWQKLVRFALALDVRTPASLRSFIRRQNDSLAAIMEKSLKNSIQKLDDASRTNEPLPNTEWDTDKFSPFRISIDEQENETSQIQVETIIGRRLWIWQMKHLLTKTINRIPNHRWTILHAPSEMSWPTSDNPLIRLNFRDSKNYDFNGGWGVKNGDILLPLSPKHLLYTCIGNRVPPRGTTLDPANAKLIKNIIIQHADRHIFSQESSDIHLIRPRLVCPITHKEEQENWHRWHIEQCKAEIELQG